MDCLIKTRDLNMEYKYTHAISSANITIKEGKIYGLIGENGAGKTTLLKILSGMLEKTSGEIISFSNNKEVENNKFFTSIGSLIEAPGLYPRMSAYDNIKAKSLCLGLNYSDKEINDLIALLGLESARNKPLSTYSLGMKQRLGIALALVGNPKILILDEPINGLDPQGIVEIRNLILYLNEKKVTIIISSHILDELSKIATDFLIIHDGKIILETSKEKLLELSMGYSLEEYYFKLLEEAKVND